MQTRVEAVIIVLFKAEVESQDQKYEVQDSRQKNSQIQMLIKTRNQNFGVTGKD